MLLTVPKPKSIQILFPPLLCFYLHSLALRPKIFQQQINRLLLYIVEYKPSLGRDYVEANALCAANDRLLPQMAR